MDDLYKQIITATELKTNLGKYLDYVIDDHQVIITKNGKRAARLSPYITDMERYMVVKEQALDYQVGGKKVSYEEFMEIYEKTDARLEYINGEIIVLGSPSAFHQIIAGNLHVLLRAYLKGKSCKVFFAPFDVHFYKKSIKEPDVMQPDLFIACDHEETINEKDRYMGTPTLVIEILSPSTRSRDMVDKLNTFMLSGVKEFWVVDPRKQSVLVYTFIEHQIDEFNNYKLGDTVESYCFQDLKVTCEAIFEK